MPWPVTINGKTYQQTDFDSFGYTVSFPNIIGDISTVALQCAADRAAVQAALSQNGNLLIPMTQGTLTLGNSTTLTVRPAGGFHWIDGLNRPIPSNITLSSSGLTVGNLYYVYIYMNGATMMMEASTTVPAIGANGVEIKSGDSTRSFVGVFQVDTGVVFTDIPAKRLICSRYNQAPREIEGPFDSGSTTSTTAVELNTNHRALFVTTSNSLVDLSAVGIKINNTAGAVSTAYVGLDGSARDMWTAAQAVSAGQVNPMAARSVFRTSVGSHIGTIRGAASSGTATFTGKLVGMIV